MKLLYFAPLILSILAACTSSGNRGAAQATEASAPAASAFLGSFSGDSAYRFVQEQLACGPRVPGSEGHRACARYIKDKLAEYGADTVVTQTATVERYDGVEMPLENIIASWNPASDRRVVLLAHYDTRPWADRDPVEANRATPIPGANDGASGVAVLLETARNFSLKRPNIGVDLAFVDCEDSGCSDPEVGDDGWCLGSRHWMESANTYTVHNKPAYGILLDMVGAPGAKFRYEYFSISEAPEIASRVWAEAAALGYSDTFIAEVAGAVNDDHIPLILAGIPTVDIIDHSHAVTGSFPPAWHTLADDITNIDPATLHLVGTVVLNILYKEQ